METLKEEKLSATELTELCAVDGVFYGNYWFPETFRQETPEFHFRIENLLNSGERHVGLEVFRGGAKTTRLRSFMSRRVAYAVSRTVLLIGKSQDHAIKSSEWLMRKIEHSTRWSTFYGLRKGSKWSSSEFEIINDLMGQRIYVLAMGITGSVRGINIDDYRPDFILLDDVQDEENAGTPEQRQKIEELVFGALLKSLAPASEAPTAMIAMAQTPLDERDLISKAKADPNWATISCSCFDNRGESAWPQRWSTETLLKDKESHINRNLLSLWLREMECKLVNSQNMAFPWELKEYYLEPEGGLVYIGVDPTPPPKDGMKKVVNEKLDDAVIMVIKYYSGKVFTLDYYIAKSPDPGEFVNKLFEFVLKYKPFLTGVETVLFQRMLKWYIDQEQQRRKIFFTVTPVEDKRKKETRIIQSISRYASNGNIYVRAEHTAFKSQYGSFMNGITGQRDDILDAFSIALDLINPALEGVIIEGEYNVLDENDIPELEDLRGAP